MVLKKELLKSLYLYCITQTVMKKIQIIFAFLKNCGNFMGNFYLNKSGHIENYL